jgi:amino acid adenylation domain-containing protein
MNAAEEEQHMTTIELLSELHSLGVTLWIEDDQLRYKAPKGALTSDLRARLIERKADIFMWLRDAQLVANTTLPVIGPRASDGELPLSFAQQRLWFLDQLQPGLLSYIIPASVRLQGRLDVAALVQSFNELIKRHAALRTTFPAAQGRPAQVIAPPAPFALKRLDLRALPPRVRAGALQQRLSAELQQPFDLARGPLLHAILIQPAADDHVLLLVMHHIISDGWSMSVLIREMAAFYAACTTGQPAALPPLQLQYADFAHWQREWLQGDVLAEQLDYWRRSLGGQLPLLELPTDRPRPVVQSFRGATHSATLPAKLTPALAALGRREGTTLFMTLLTGFAILLARYTGQVDLIIGSPIANRNRTEIEGLIGFFVNTLVLRANAAGDPTVRALLARLRAVTLGAYAHQDLPFEQLVELVRPERHLSHTPLFQVLFVLQNAPQSTLELPGLTLEALELDSDIAKFDLSLMLTEAGDELFASIEYSTDLFDTTTIRRMLRHFEQLLAGMAAAPDRRIADLALLSAAERQQALVEWNDTNSQYPQTSGIHALFGVQAARTPDAVAAIFDAHHLTYAELDRRANQLARHLRAQGAGCDMIVGVCLDRSLALIISILATLKAGAAYLPLDPSYPTDRLAFMLADSQAAVLLIATQDAGRRTQDEERVQPAVVRLSSFVSQMVDLSADGPLIARQPVSAPPGAISADAIAYVIYTSGSTGIPKGSRITHRAIARLLYNNYYVNLNADDRIVQAANTAFDAAIFEVWGALLYGGCLVGVATQLALTPQPFAAFLRAQAITTLFLTTALFNSLAHAAPATFAPLRRLLFGGEAADPSAVRAVLDAQPPQRLLNAYGPTESTTFTTMYHATVVAPDATTVPIGRPIDNTQIYVLDRAMRPAPIGVAGELYIGGAGLVRDYLGRPDLTAARFVPNPFATTEDERRKTNDEAAERPCVLRPSSCVRLYKTGDRVRWRSDGVIEFLGRIDGQVKLRGYRIELDEIAAVLGQHAAVRDCVVVVREAAGASGYADKRLVAYVVPDADERRTTNDEAASSSSVLRPSSFAQELRSFLATKLPDYMLPAAFVPLDALPLTPNGKVDYRALPAPSAARPEDAAPFEAPRTPTEELVAQIWAEVLGLERLGAHDEFFALGGHSLLAAQVIARVRETFQIELPLRSLFETPTVAGLAERITAGQRGMQELPPLQPAPRDAALPLSFAQQRLWFLDRLQPDSPAYNIPIAVRMIGSLDVRMLHASLNAILQRHEALRTTFAEADGQPVQIIGTPTPLALAFADLRALPETIREAEAIRHATVEALRPFDLVRGPLVRAMLLRLNAAEHVLLLTMHHIVSDGWSMGVAIRELSALYSAFARGEPSPLPALAIQYADFAYWQHRWMERPPGADQLSPLQTQLAYWHQQLAGLPVLELPTDYSRPPVATFRGATQAIALPAQLSAELLALSRACGATLFMTLLTAWKLVLARYSGQDDIVVGSPIANRTQRATEDLIGFFVNTLTLRSDLAGNPTFQVALARVREVCLGAYTHQDAPFEQVVEAVAPPRDLSRHPLFQVVFALQNAPMTELTLPELTLHPVALTGSTTKVDLALFMAEGEAGLVAGLEYRTDLFDRPTVVRMLGHFRTLLAGIVAQPQQHVAALPLLSVAERHQLLHGWNDTATAYPQSMRLHQLVDAAVARGPDAIAISADGQHLTYRELHQRANQLANHLQRHGVGPDVLVALCIERASELTIGLLGTLKAGGAYLPLDPTYPAERLSFMLQDSRAPVLITTTDDGRVRPIVVRLSSFVGKVVDLSVDWPQIARLPTDAPACAVSAQHLAYVIYTSGSTGRPKGVAIAHQSAVNSFVWYQAKNAFRAADRISQAFSTAFDPFGLELWPALASGSSLHFIDAATRADPLRLRDWLIDQAITLCLLPTPLIAPLLSLPWPARLPLRALLTGGDTLHQGPPPQLPFTLTNNYGPTEATVVATAGIVPAHARTERPPEIGRPIANTQVYLLDAHMQPVPIGVPGELYIGGVGVARGYLGRPDLTAERFVPNPFVTTNDERRMTNDDTDARPVILRPSSFVRLYKTGDLARYRPDGDIMFLGRRDSQVKLRGFRIELGEIEALLAQHPAVQDGVVLVRGEASGTRRLVAYVVPTEDAGRRTNDESAPSSSVVRPSSFASELRAFLAARLPEYMLPAAFVVLDALPKTPNGKLDRQALPPDAVARESEYGAPPRSPIEELLVGIWSDILGRSHVGIHDNFFALGGHSLLATQVIARIRAALGIELPLRSLFETPSIAGFAEQVALTQRLAHGLQAPPLAPSPRGGPLPLSFAQQRLWVLDQLQPGLPTYNMPVAIALSGALDLAALQRSVAAIIRRHEALRTTFALIDGSAVQLIAAPAPCAIPLIDLRTLPAPSRADAAQQLLAQAAQAPFDLIAGPLLRLSLLRLAAQEHWLLLVLHHIVADGWSMGVLVRELATLYPAYAAGQPAALPTLPIQYADFAIWQRSWLQGAVLDGQLDYWRRSLGGELPLLDLPTDRPRPPVQTFQGASQSRALPLALTSALRALSQRAGATLFMTLLAAFDVLLARYTGQRDLLIGIPIANRQRAEIEPLIGFFVNTLVLRGDLSGDPSFDELLARVRTVTLDAYAHQDLPFERLVDELRLARDTSHAALVQVMFSLQNTPIPALELPGLTLQPVELANDSAKFDLSLTLAEGPDGLVAALTYATALFDAPTITRLLGHYQALLEGIVAAPGRRISTLSPLTPAERQHLLIECNDLPADVPHNQPIHARFAAQAARTPDAIALSAADQQLTYRQLDQRANRLGNLLRTYGVGPATPVGVCLERSLDLVVALLAVLKAGGAYLPLDPTYPTERLAFMLEDSRAAVLIVATTDDGRRTTDGWGGADLPIVDLAADQPRIAAERADNLDGAASADSLAYVIYTSGSTGTPKGVAIPHHALAHLIAWHQRAFDLCAADRTSQVAGMAFDAAGWEIWPTLTIGASLHLIDDTTRADPPQLRDWLLTQAITLSFVPTPLAAQLIRLPWPARTRLRALLTGGEALPHAPSAKLPFVLVNNYGPTEATVVATSGAVPAGATAERPPAIGRPIANTQAYVLDGALQPVPIGVAGELYLGGAGLAWGYLQRPELTAERFMPNPFATTNNERRMTNDDDSDRSCVLRPASCARLYKTGDRARYRVDGQIEFLGRIDGQVKLRGYRIELSEITALLDQHPAVRASVVLIREDRPDIKQLVAYVVPANDERRTTNDEERDSSFADLRDFLRARLPAYMIPAAFVLLDRLPLTANGKIDHAQLPAPDAARRDQETAYVAPRTPAERTLAQLWSQLLGRTEIGIYDNFFALGGDSILSIQLVARAQQAGLALTPRQVFEHQTIAALALVVGTASAALPNQSPFPTDDVDYPLAPQQQEMLRASQYDGRRGVYIPQWYATLQGALDIPAFIRAWQTVLDRHIGLRASFHVAAQAEPIQRFHQRASLPWLVCDLRELPPASQQRWIAEYRTAERLRGFDLTAAPLMRLAVLLLADERAAVILTHHHLLIDGWSVQVVLREVFAGYTAARRGIALGLPAAPSYAAYLAWLQRQDQEAAAAFWHAQLAGHQPSSLANVGDEALPADADGVGEQSITLTEATTAALQQLARTAHLTPNTLVQGAWALLLAGAYGTDEVVVGVTQVSRPAALDEVEALVGPLINTLPLRVRIALELPLSAWLRDIQARQAALRQYDYSALAQVRRWAGIEPEQPLFSSVVRFQSYPPDQVPTETLDELTVTAVEAIDLWHHPLNLVVTPGPVLLLKLGYDQRRFSAAMIADLLAPLPVLLAGMADNIEQPVAALLDQLTTPPVAHTPSAH